MKTADFKERIKQIIGPAPAVEKPTVRGPGDHGYYPPWVCKHECKHVGCGAARRYLKRVQDNIRRASTSAAKTAGKTESDSGVVLSGGIGNYNFRALARMTKNGARTRARSSRT